MRLSTVFSVVLLLLGQTSHATSSIAQQDPVWPPVWQSDQSQPQPQNQQHDQRPAGQPGQQPSQRTTITIIGKLPQKTSQPPTPQPTQQTYQSPAPPSSRQPPQHPPAPQQSKQPSQQATWQPPQQPTWVPTQPSAWGQPQQPAWSQPQQPAWGQPQQPTWGQPQQPAWSEPQQPAWGQPQQPVWSQPQQPAWGPLQQPAQQQAKEPSQEQPTQQPQQPQQLPRVPSSCKHIPDTAGWPSDFEWAKLNQAVGGRLLKPDAPAAGCHGKKSGISGSLSCAKVNDGWNTAEFHVNHPTSTIWQNWNNYSCPLDTRQKCSATGYPVYVVAAKDASDVKAAVDFARTKNVRLNIKSTGHDFLGRSIQPYSLSIWTHGLKGLRWFDTSFTPKGCSMQINGAAVTVMSGNQWGEVYESAKSKRVSIVGGAINSVGVAGYLSNGGHGKLSAKYGYGADMVLQIELVNAAGEFITANECMNQDYFWAMRGGGGSTYGVALSFTIQAVPSTQIATYVGTLNSWDQIIRVHSRWARIANAGAGGYINGHPAKNGKASLSIYMPNATQQQLHAIVDPIVGTASRIVRSTNETERIEPEILGRYSSVSSWEIDESEGGHESVSRTMSTGQATLAEALGTGANKIISSWMWSAQNVSSPRLAAALKGAYDSETQLLTDATMGVGTARPPYGIRGGGNAISPAMRSAIMRPASELHWEGTNPQYLATRQRDSLKFGASLRSLNPNGGTYPNEADPNMPNWQAAFWGSNYPKLLQIKRIVDPAGVFYCRSCVGSELYEDRGGMLCRR